VASTLTRWLRTLSPDALVDLLGRRPEALTPPAPRDLAELAARLQGRAGVALAFQSVPLPAVQVLETVCGYSCRTRAELAELLDAVSKIRNAVMHFRPNGISDDDSETLKRAVRLLRHLPSEP